MFSTVFSILTSETSIKHNYPSNRRDEIHIAVSEVWNLHSEADGSVKLNAVGAEVHSLISS